MNKRDSREVAYRMKLTAPGCETKSLTQILLYIGDALQRCKLGTADTTSPRLSLVIS